MRRQRIAAGSLLIVLILQIFTHAVPAGAAPAVASPLMATTVFINEIHYDNDGADTGEAVEIAGPAGTAISGWSLVLYNGNGGAPYETMNLSGTLPDQQGGYGTLEFYPSGSIQNGSPDGVALVDGLSNVIQFLSYEGNFTAVGGPADGMTSTDIGVAEGSSTAVGESLQLSGTGTAYEDFTWSAPAANTFGAVNTNQAFGSLPAKINEFVFNHTSYDTHEFVEVYGAPSTDYSALTLLQIEGDSSSGPGTIDSVTSVGTTDTNGFWVTGFLSDAFENGTVSLLLVDGFTGSAGDDLDTNDDGTLDSAPWTELVDDVAVSDGNTTDITYSSATLTAYYDGLAYTPGGASRIPDGADTDTQTDWVRNDWDLAGIDGFSGSIGPDEAYNTPGETNQVYTPPPEACGDPYTTTYAIQGSGLTSPIVGTEVAVEGVVVGDFQDNASPDDGDLRGFHIQDPTGDDDPATSDGVFVYAPGSADVSTGDRVRVRGTVSEYHDMTQVGSVSQVWLCSSGHTITPTVVTLPVSSSDDLEPYEGMLIEIPQPLVISEYYNFGRYGEIVLATDRQYQPTAIYEPGSPEAAALAEANILARITLDDGRTSQNPDPAIHPNGATFDMTNRFRGGDTVENVIGVLDYSYGLYRVQPTQGATYRAANPRPAQPDDVGGDLSVAAFNVLNYFTTLDTGADICGPAGDQGCRGADTAEEFTRQRTKIITALLTMDADVVGLVEIENHPEDVPTADLVSGLNDEAGAGTYDYIATGAIGTDAIRVAFIYKAGAVTPVGDFAVLDHTVDSRFLDDYNRPVLAQAFQDRATGSIFTVAVNHLKSKGSPCDAVGDPDTGDGAGNCNLTRKAAAEALVDWLATDPTGSGDPDALIIGDLNAYDEEDPIDVLVGGGYTDLVDHFQGDTAYSYVFDGQFGYLDYALANASLLDQITGATVWHINADEPNIIDYDTSYKKDAQDALYAPDSYRASDHDPVVVGIQFATDTTLQKTVTPLSVRPGETVTYTVVLANNGTGDDTVTVTDTLPSDVTFSRWVEQPSGVQLDAGEGEISWTGTLTVGHTITFTFTATNSAASGTVTNTAEFTGRADSGIHTAVFEAVSWKMIMPVIMKSFTP